VSPLPRIKLSVSRRDGPRRDPQNRVERIHWVEATVEAKYEFIEVGLQMIRLDSTMMCAVDPRLQIGEDKMDHRQVFFRLIWIAAERQGAMPIADFIKGVITTPSVSANDGTGRYIVLHESGQSITIAPRNIGVRDNTKPETASVISPTLSVVFIGSRPNLDGANYGRLMVNSLSLAARPAANAALIYLDGVWQADRVAIWPHHTGAELMKHGERSLIGGNTKLPLKLNGGLPRRLRSHEICAPKPSRERHMRGLHDRPGREGSVFLTGATTQHNRRARGKTVWLAGNSAFLAREAVRPADRLQIAGASVVIREDALKLWKARGEVCVHALDTSIGTRLCQATR
jgi:hypothetical protein